MYVHEYLKFIGRLNGINAKALKSRVSEMIEKCGLRKEQNKLIGALSKGYRQRVGLAQTLIHDPDVLILDEPTTGLDPNQITEVRELIKGISKEKTVILSTHIMQEVQAICDKVVIINEGKIVADGPLDELQKMRAGQQKVKIRFSSKMKTEELSRIQDVEEVSLHEDDGYAILIAIKGKDIRPNINKFVNQNGLELLELSVQEDTLEDIFRKVTKTSESE